MSPPELVRFGPAARLVHRATAVLGLVCVATATALYLEPVAQLVGRRALVVDVHVWSGLLLPVPAVLGWLSAAYRADLRLLNRFGPVDRIWLRRRDRRSAGLPVGKFNAGQKLNAALSAGGTLVLLGTGVVLAYGRGWPLDLRIGATFVHDWTAAAWVLLVGGHVWKAFQDEDARRGMRTGSVPLGWARTHHPAWVGAVAAGHDPVMEPDQDRISQRARDLLPEERAAGSDDPEAQAAAILADSDEREHVPDAAPDTVLEQRRSEDTV
jgi:formate dehydrogenase subunit gamma